MMNKRLMKSLCIACIGTMCVGMLAGCGKKEEPLVPQPEPSVTAEEPEEAPIEGTIEEVVTDEKPEGMERNLLTGEWIDAEVAGKRPFAVMVGNTSDALPQYGISQADVIYEAPVEGALTRLMPIFQDYRNLDQIGSVRSCREYYAYYALEFDALYGHYGQASYALDFLNQDYVNNLSGLDSAVESVMYYRDKNLKPPHNAFTSTDGIIKGAETKGYRMDYEEGYTGHYQFAEDGQQIELQSDTVANVVKPGYLVNKPWFEYNPDDGLYYRYQYGDKQVDGMNNEQLAVKNILMQESQWSVIDEGAGYLDVKTIDSGNGWYITNGKAMPVTWSRTDKFSPTKYYDADGNEIVLNQGKTWVCIIQDTYADNITFSESE